jgi:hypothetical protein
MELQESQPPQAAHQSDLRPTDYLPAAETEPALPSVLPGPERVQLLEKLQFLGGFQAGRFHGVIVAVDGVFTNR